MIVKLCHFVVVSSCFLGLSNRSLAFSNMGAQSKLRFRRTLTMTHLGLFAQTEDDAENFLEEMRNKVFGEGTIPSNPFEGKGLSKADLYDEDELTRVWNAHQSISDEIAMDRSDDFVISHKNHEDRGGTDVMSLHEELLSVLGREQFVAPPLEVVEPPSASWLDDNFRDRIKRIRAIASDVDGTLLSSKYTLHPRTKRAIQEAVAMADDPDNKLVKFFPATGKSRRGCLNSLGHEIGSLLSSVPGVFIQGLYVVDGNGKVVFERKLDQSAVVAAEKLASSASVSIIGYDGDTLYTTNLDETVRTISTRYGEPMPVELTTPFHNHEPGLHKILFLDEDTEKLTNVLRPKLEALATEYNASVTQAMPTILELLPPGCSKALGVTKLCDSLGIDIENELLALGDAENDVELLKTASIGVAMGNASPPASDAADFQMEETNDQGGAGAAIETFGFGYAL